MKEAKAYGCKLLAIILGSTGPSVFMKYFDTADRYSSVMLFMLFGGIAMLLVFAMMSRFTRNDSERIAEFSSRTVSWPSVVQKILLASVTTAVTYCCYVYAMHSKSVTETALIVRVGPLFNVLLAIFILGEKVRSWKGITVAVVICLPGIAVAEGVSIVKAESLFSLFMLTALFAAFCLSLNQVLERSIHKTSGLPKLIIAGSIMIGGGLLIGVGILVLGQPVIIPNMTELLVLLYLGFGTVGIPKILNLSAFHFIDNFSKLAFMDYLIPICAAVSAYLIIGERGFEYGNLAIGFVFISVGIWVADRSMSKNI